MLVVGLHKSPRANRIETGDHCRCRSISRRLLQRTQSSTVVRRTATSHEQTEPTIQAFLELNVGFAATTVDHVSLSSLLDQYWIEELALWAPNVNLEGININFTLHLHANLKHYNSFVNSFRSADRIVKFILSDKSKLHRTTFRLTRLLPKFEFKYFDLLSKYP